MIHHYPSCVLVRNQPKEHIWQWFLIGYRLFLMGLLTCIMLSSIWRLKGKNKHDSLIWSNVVWQCRLKVWALLYCFTFCDCKKKISYYFEKAIYIYIWSRYMKQKKWWESFENTQHLYKMWRVNSQREKKVFNCHDYVCKYTNFNPRDH